MGAIAEYRKKDAEFQNRQKELDAVTAQRDEARRMFEGTPQTCLIPNLMSLFVQISASSAFRSSWQASRT